MNFPCTFHRDPADQSAPANNGAHPSGALLSVELEADQEVEWIWSHYANGTSAVTGYRKVPRKATARLAPIASTGTVPMTKAVP